MITVWTVIALAAAKGWHMHQMDVMDAFLQGELEKEVYMVQPPDFESNTHLKAVCRLKNYDIPTALHPQLVIQVQDD